MKRFIFLLCSIFLWILRYREVSTSVYSYIALFRIVGWKKQVLSTLKGKSDGYATVDTSWYWVLLHLLLLRVPINHPKLILKELFNLQSSIPTSFQHEKILFRLPLHFLESSAYCVLLSASLRTGFYRMKI